MILTKRAFLAASLVAASGVVRAQAYPSKSIRLIVPLAPGATADIVARVFAEELGKALGQTVVVDNKTGAGGTIATAEAARAPADGYTVALVSQGTLVFNMGLYKAPGLRFAEGPRTGDGERRRLQRADRASRQSGEDGGRRAGPGARQARPAHLLVGRRRHQPSHVGRAVGAADRREAAARALPRDARRHPGGGQRRGDDGPVQHADGHRPDQGRQAQGASPSPARSARTCCPTCRP